MSEASWQEENETDETLAILIGAGLIVVIAVVDLFLPANYNLAILYVVPLFLCAWSRSRRLLWGMLATLLVLSVVGFFVGPSVISMHVQAGYMAGNRILAALATTLVAVLLHFQIGAGNQGPHPASLVGSRVAWSDVGGIVF